MLEGRSEIMRDRKRGKERDREREMERCWRVKTSPIPNKKTYFPIRRLKGVKTRKKGRGISPHDQGD